jgi:hypothetical protein
VSRKCFGNSEGKGGWGEEEMGGWGEEGKIEGLKVRKFEGLRGLISRMRFF